MQQDRSYFDVNYDELCSISFTIWRRRFSDVLEEDFEDIFQDTMEYCVDREEEIEKPKVYFINKYIWLMREFVEEGYKNLEEIKENLIIKEFRNFELQDLVTIGLQVCQSEKDKRIFELRLVEELGRMEVARELDTSPDYVSQRAKLILKKIRAYLLKSKLY